MGSADLHRLFSAAGFARMRGSGGIVHVWPSLSLRVKLGATLWREVLHYSDEQLNLGF